MSACSGHGVKDHERCYKRIEMKDLNRLADIAKKDIKDLFSRNKRLSKLADKVICVALCQGAAQHIVDGKTGIKDFDVFTFFDNDASVKFPPRRRKVEDFKDPKFGRTIDHSHFTGRRIDLMGRSIFYVKGNGRGDPIRDTLVHYLSGKKTATAIELSKKSVVLLEPASRRGEIIW